MKKSRLLGAVCACLAVVSFNASAELVERTFNFSVTSDLIYDTIDRAGNAGKEIELLEFTEAFFLNSGDTLITHINFDKPLLITDTDNNFKSSLTGNSIDKEPINFTYWFTDGISGTGSNAEATISYEITFDILSGIPASSSLTGNFYTAGGGTSVGGSISSNITDSVLMIKGIDIITHINSYTLVRNDGEYSVFVANIRAGDISIVPTPVYSCAGNMFEPPFSEIITLKNTVKKAIPVKMPLVDADGNLITDSDISSPPVVSVSFASDAGVDNSNNSDLVPPGLADDGNEFRYDYPYWVINLATKQFTSAGTYAVTAVAGDTSYMIDASSCSGTFIRLP